jgi:hypothetical protein
MKDRVELLTDYLNELKNLAVEFPADKYNEKIQKVCYEIESELNIPRKLDFFCKIDIEPEKVVKNIMIEMEKRDLLYK